MSKTISVVRVLFCAAFLLGASYSLFAQQEGDRKGDAPKGDNQNRKADTPRNDAQRDAQRGDREDAAKGDARFNNLTDEKFVQMASASDLAEINAGRMAMEKATSPEVKNYARHMVEDHTMASRQLTTLADAKKIKPAQQMDEKHREAAEKLMKLQGKEFDQAYMQQMVKDHQEAVSLFQAQAKNGKDEDLRQYADKTLPKLREHLKMARNLAGEKGDRGDKTAE